jgi:hypothetical protein
MKFSQASLLAACLPAVSARFIEIAEADNVVLQPDELFLIETAPGRTQWVTEEEKWELRRVSLIHVAHALQRRIANTPSERPKLHGHYRDDYAWLQGYQC